MIGSTLAHYEITALLGKGGMGEVYRARDGKLGRDVALKMITGDVAGDPERLARFRREARTLASLSHPHIAQIFGIEEADGKTFLVMELVEGEDLFERLKRGPLSVDDALETAEAIALALESAHEQGIVHRDLKPANVKLAPDGRVKLLDFGLARAALDGDEGADPATSPTVTAAFTQAGTILGTAAYMAPEQARGKIVDRRADIWAFGVVLWEMLTGRRMFDGETVSDTLASVIKDTPDLDVLPDDTPPLVRVLIARCLEKDPRRRLQSMGEARIAIEQVRGGGADASLMTSALGSPAPALDAPAAPSRARWAWLAAVVLVGALGVAIGTRLPGGDASEPRLRHFDLQPTGLDVSYPRNPTLSPDGRRIAYRSNEGIRIRDLHRLEPTLVPDTDTAGAMFWSPDGAWLAFGNAGRIWKVAAEGGRPEVVCDVAFVNLDGGMWGDDGTLVLAPDSGPLQRVRENGGDPEEVFPLEGSDTDYHTPTVLPDGRGILYTRHDGGGREAIEVFANGVRKEILRIPGARLEYAAWSQGHIVYHRQQTNPGVWAAPFDPDRLELTGEPFLVDAAGSFPSVARDGSLLYARGATTRRVQAVIVDRGGRIVERIGEPRDSLFRHVASPDGTELLAEQEGNIWRIDMARGTRTRMTFDVVNATHPAWIGDGSSFAYSVATGGSNPKTFVRATDGRSAARLLCEGFDVHSSAGTDRIVFSRFQSGSILDLFHQSISGEDSAQVLVQTPRLEQGAQLSPDGRFVAYTSDVSGANEVYVRRFPSGEGPWQLSLEGGVWPRWERDGSGVVYRQRSGSASRMMSVSLDTEGDEVRPGAPVELFGASDLPSLVFVSGYGAYDTLPDGRLVMVEVLAVEGDTSGPRLVFVEDWWASSRGRGD